MKKDRAKQAFTLLELVIAIFVFSIGMAGIFALSSTMLRMNAFKGRFAEAMLLAEGKIEELRGMDYPEIVSGTDTNNAVFTSEWTITPETNLSYKVVKVNVKWTDMSGRIRKTSLRTMIAE